MQAGNIRWFRRESRGRIYSALAVVVLALLCFPASSSADLYDDTPLLNVGGDSHLLGQAVDLEVDLDHLDQAGDTERLVVTVPSGYAVNLVHPVGADIGSAAVETVPTGGGNPRLFLGTLVAMDPAAYAASASAQACSPGAHAALWQMQMSSGTTTLSIPIAVDPSSGAYTLAMCFDDEHAQNLEIATVFFDADLVFGNPSAAGRYVFSALVTPFASDGTASTAAAFELHAVEDLPQTLSAVARYNQSTKAFTVRGTLRANGAARAGINVHVYAGRTHDPKEVGVAVTQSNGSYVFTKRLATAPTYAVGSVNHYWRVGCVGASTAPAGCASQTIDGTSSPLIKVPVIRAPKKKR